MKLGLDAWRRFAGMLLATATCVSATASAQPPDPVDQALRQQQERERTLRSQQEQRPDVRPEPSSRGGRLARTALDGFVGAPLSAPSTFRSAYSTFGFNLGWSH